MTLRPQTPREIAAAEAMGRELARQRKQHLRELTLLHKRGLIDDAEFAAAKTRLGVPSDRELLDKFRRMGILPNGGAQNTARKTTQTQIDRPISESSKSADHPEFNVGERVLHRTYGEGVIKDRFEIQSIINVVVQFGSQRRPKHFDLRTAVNSGLLEARP